MYRKGDAGGKGKNTGKNWNNSWSTGYESQGDPRKGRSWWYQRPDTSARREAEQPVVDESQTDEVWQPLDRTLWLDEKMLKPDGSGEQKSYVLLWENGLLYVDVDDHRFPLPSIVGGIRWGDGGRTNAPPKFTLAIEDAEEDRLIWRRPDGTVSNTWVLEDIDVDVAPSRTRRRSWPSRSQDGGGRAIWGARAQYTRAVSVDEHDLATDDTYKYLANSSWTDEKATTKGGVLKTYELHWKGCTLYAWTGNRNYALPSIEGGLRWGVPAPGYLLPKYTLADEDMEEDKLIWRSPGGEIAFVWFLEG